jgi:methylenetetrahydrofolate reductase (NADPH)
MKIIDLLGRGAPAFSFEFFPPKGEAGMAVLFETLADLRDYRPSYVSVTYGAGGSTRELTVELVRRIKHELGMEAMAHLTCVGATQAEIGQVLDSLRAAGIDNVIALRGDPPKGETEFQRTAGGFAHASELVTFVRQNYGFCIAGACYPESHPEAVSAEQDLAALKVKVDSGAQFLITQLFFEADAYFRFVERARQVGITVPIVAGIMPITNVAQIKRFTSMCGASIPAELLAELELHENDQKKVREIGVRSAVELCTKLLLGGVPGIHFYTLNRSHATREILDALRARGLAS